MQDLRAEHPLINSLGASELLQQPRRFQIARRRFRSFRIGKTRHRSRRLLLVSLVTKPTSKPYIILISLRCFPIVPKLACHHLGLPTTNPPKPITLLGGLTSFGGAGNNYSMHVCSTFSTHPPTHPPKNHRSCMSMDRAEDPIRLLQK